MAELLAEPTPWWSLRGIPNKTVGRDSPPTYPASDRGAGRNPSRLAFSRRPHFISEPAHHQPWRQELAREGVPA